MNTQLTSDDVDVILTSLEYSKRATEEYRDYPTQEFKQDRLSRIDAVITKIRSLRDNDPGCAE